jgi:endogenous inhibitor of DNA gyrase (YacG/DUF329 family)
MHRAVWKSHYGPIPEGCGIHHRDENKANNSIENLELLPLAAHASLHTRQRLAENPKVFEKSIEAAREAARHWHGSLAGREWHAKHGKESWIGRESLTYSCAHCGKAFECLRGAIKRGFCSMSCQGMARVLSGVDNETRTCVECGKSFEANKYAKKRTCSKPCASAQMVKKRNSRG